jgi:ribonuclease-3
MRAEDAVARGFEKASGCHFQNKSLLKQALSHKSASPSKDLSHFERLEFLGDRVLNLVISHSLFERFPQESEADLSVRLSKLINRSSLYRVSETLNLKQYTHFDRTTPHPQKILSDTLEAIIGALFLDAGFQVAKRCVQRWWTPLFNDSSLDTLQDSKSALQAWTQKHYGTKPIYTLVTQTGPAHAPHIEIDLKIETRRGEISLKASGSSRRYAEKKAAQEMLRQLTGTTRNPHQTGD